jgi:hypothetical protein
MTKLDSIYSALVSKQAAHLKRWGTICPFPLESLTDLEWDGRKVGRNWELIDEISRDRRFTVSKDANSRFNEVQISLN